MELSRKYNYKIHSIVIYNKTVEVASKINTLIKEYNVKNLFQYDPELEIFQHIQDSIKLCDKKELIFV